MKIIAYTALLYGKEYLSYAMRSVLDHVDEYHILYSALGAHGHRTDVPCPETRDELYRLAAATAGDKLRWHDGEWAYEGQQRESIFNYAPDADIILTVDSDEVYGGGMVEDAVTAYMNPETPGRLRVPFIHYWRSFYRAVLHDPAYPVRVIYPKRAPLEGYLSTKAVVNHFGYAQSSATVQYKLLTHGHRNEFRRDCDWFNDVFMPNLQNDTHPVGSIYWNPEEINPLDYLPAYMREHPYYTLEVIP